MIRIAKGLQKTRVIAKYLKTLNSTKEKDDFIYEETRRIVGATFQNIVYREYLPLVLGRKLMREYGLNIKPGIQTEYDPNKDATLWHEFGSFSYRYQHQHLLCNVSNVFPKIWAHTCQSRIYNNKTESKVII